MSEASETPWCACGRRREDCDGSRRACVPEPTTCDSCQAVSDWYCRRCWDEAHRWLHEAETARDEAQKQARLGWERHAEKDRAYGDALRQRDDACSEAHAAAKENSAMAEHIERMQELIDSIALMVGTPGDDPGDLDGFEVLRLHARAAVDRGKRAEQVLDALAGEFERAIHHHESRGKGGQQVTFTGDFASVGPSVVGRMRWWLRDMRPKGGA